MAVGCLIGVGITVSKDMNNDSHKLTATLAKQQPMKLVS